ncbi:hypothetical protein PHMEG_0006580 [Phytophthora megakarya]|uniref:DDE Tnp4 domain-containing protein n=1 Tax=Phytophthora megakarya TaxID=4795 RepID=A0A225WNI4_9STRA|nr:hypothetical protein PHMEG_0006580 [Phytophthora megakarya]
MALKRLAFPCRLSDLRKPFGRSNGVCCRVTLNVASFIIRRWGDVLFFCDTMFVSRLPQYKSAVTAASGNIVDGIALFIDGTKHFICRPSPRLDAPRGKNLQKVAYSGHKRRHCLSYQGVITPDGLFISFWGPVEGRRHDTTLLRHSGLLEYVETHPVLRQLRFNIYGDPAYSVSDLISVPYQGASLTQDMKACNALLISLRVAVELGFNPIKRYFARLEYAKAHKIRLSPLLSPLNVKSNATQLVPKMVKQRTDRTIAANMCQNTALNESAYRQDEMFPCVHAICAAFLGFAKAYDRVNWDYLFQVLTRVGYGPIFCSWVRLLYSDVQAVLSLNGSLQEILFPTRGVKQGDPLSSLLFVLSIEPLGNLLRNRPELGIAVSSNYVATGVFLRMTRRYCPSHSMR